MQAKGNYLITFIFQFHRQLKVVHDATQAGYYSCTFTGVNKHRLTTWRMTRGKYDLYSLYDFFISINKFKVQILE